MTYATEFFEVQKALGFEDKSIMSSAPFRAYDEKYKSEGRLVDVTKTHPSGKEMRGIFVDGAAIKVFFGGNSVNVPSDEAKKFFGI